MAFADTSMLGAAIPVGGTLRGARRLAAALRAKFGPLRIGYTLLVALLVSTQVFFQPDLADSYSAYQIFRGWLEYFAECLLMAFPLLVAATLGEVLLQRRSRKLAWIAMPLALAAGAVIGSLLLLPYYDYGLDYVGTSRWWGDTLYWFVIATAIAAIYGHQQAAAAAHTARHQAQVDRVALSKQMLEAQLQVMRAQIEPHFLFNTLANVKRLTQTDVEGGLAMLDNLVRYLRAALPQLREGTTTLGQEADLLRAYLSVLQIRMGTRLSFSIDVPQGLRARPFPPMMLLTLAENAIKHGLTPAPDGGTLAIRARAVGGDIRIDVADTGVGFGVAATGGTGVGLANTRARLGAIYGDGAGLDLAQNTPTGVVATIRIPLDPVELADAA